MKARFDEVFGQLRAILQPYADSLLVKQDGPYNYSLSPALKKRLHGKSCLNFTSLDETQTEELARLTQASFEQYREAGLL